MPLKNKHPVAKYYDANTRRFLVVGGSRGAVAIHRELWGPGIETSEAAAAHVNDLVAQAGLAALESPPDTVSDLGCGVGGTMFHLARLWPAARFMGHTLSETQARMGQTMSAERGLSERCRVMAEDFTTVTAPVPADLAVAIESHTHVASLLAFLMAAKRHLKPGGVLIMVDDVLAKPFTELPSSDQVLVETFKRGWRLAHMPSIGEITQTAEALGLTLVNKTDLSPLLRLNRLRDHALRVVAPLADKLGLGRFALFANMIGGNALTQLHRQGTMRYMMIVMRAT